MINFVNNGVEDTVCFHTGYRTRAALINEIGYVVWNIGFEFLGEISEGVMTRGLEIHGVLGNYFEAYEDKYKHV